jgi:hypothetical protein
LKSSLEHRGNLLSDPDRSNDQPLSHQCCGLLGFRALRHQRFRRGIQCTGHL